MMDLIIQVTFNLGKKKHFPNPQFWGFLLKEGNMITDMAT